MLKFSLVEVYINDPPPEKNEISFYRKLVTICRYLTNRVKNRVEIEHHFV